MMMTQFEKAAARWEAKRDEIAIKLILEKGYPPYEAAKIATEQLRGKPLFPASEEQNEPT